MNHPEMRRPSVHRGYFLQKLSVDLFIFICYIVLVNSSNLTLRHLPGPELLTGKESADKHVILKLQLYPLYQLCTVCFSP